MSITFADKNASAAVGSAERTWRAVDANEVKNEFNTLESSVSPFTKVYTGLVGGGNNNLDGLITSSLSTPRLALALINNSLSFWVLVAGTQVEDGVNVIRPDDYADATNEKVWIPAL